MGATVFLGLGLKGGEREGEGESKRERRQAQTDRVGGQMESAWLLWHEATNLMWSDTSSLLYG